MRAITRWWLLCAALLCPPAIANDQAPTVNLGSKAFTESVILGEMLRHLAEHSGATATHQRQLGGTRILWNALLSGEIDAYPEYTGTLLQEILAQERLTSEQALHQALAERGLRMTPPLGFNNTYALGVTPALAEQLNLQRISDLRRHPELMFGFANEFMDRADGWPGLSAHYQLPHTNVRGLDHDLAYRGLNSGALNVIDLYSTDAEIDYYQLHVLEDDLHFFPVYNAVIIYRAELAERAPAVIANFQRLAGRIDATTMSSLNARAKIAKAPETQIAADAVEQLLGVTVQYQSQSAWQQFIHHTKAHLVLVAISLSAAIVIAIPLGVLAAKMPRLGHGVLAIVGVLQTVPSLALFVFMIPLLGIGGLPAIAALFLYSLLPIVRNTYSGLQEIPRHIRESAQALGLPPAAQLRVVELPLATRSILAGIKTAAVINVGTATLGALIGAGGYGQPILTGIRLDDTWMILQGAIPAAVLALLVQGVFEAIERYLLPRGLNNKLAQS